jgi:hypothetical protein
MAMNCESGLAHCTKANLVYVVALGFYLWDSSRTGQLCASYDMRKS